MRTLVNTRFVVPLAAVALAASPARAQEAGPAAASEIVTAASAERAVPADLGTVTLRFTRRGKTPLAAEQRVAAQTDSIRRALQALGIPRDSVVNGSRWYWWNERIRMEVENRNEPIYEVRNGTRFVVGSESRSDTSYDANETLQVRVRDLSAIGRAIDAVLALGVTDISDITFTATNTEAAQREATGEATRRARARAEAIASASGARLGRTLRLSTEGDNAPRRAEMWDLVSLGSSTAPRGAQTVIVAPMVRVAATVTGRWELLGGAAPGASSPAP